MKRLWYVIFIVLLVPLHFFCFNPFAPELNDQIDLSNVITEQQTPNEVLQNFQFAYTFRDSLLYSDVLDESFVFEFFDPTLEPSGGLRTWSRDVDLKTTGSLFRNFDVINLVWLNKLFEECDGGETCKKDGDDVDYTKHTIVTQFIRFSLSLFSSQENITFSGTAIFTFEYNETDKKWRIIRWKDESEF